MAVGKNKRISKGRKGSKKKAVDPFTKKQWYDIKAPLLFTSRNVGKTLVSRTQGTKIASEGLKHRVFEVSLADLQNDEDQAYRKIRLRAEDVQGMNVLTNFWGMDFTTDKLRSLVRKWQTLIEAHVDVKTTDNYMLRMFAIGFTKRRPNQVKRTCYAQASQIRQIRRKMVEIMVNQAASCDLKELVNKFIPEVIGNAGAGFMNGPHDYPNNRDILGANQMAVQHEGQYLDSLAGFMNGLHVHCSIDSTESSGYYPPAGIQMDIPSNTCLMNDDMSHMPSEINMFGGQYSHANTMSIQRDYCNTSFWNSNMHAPIQDATTSYSQPLIHSSASLDEPFDQLLLSEYNSMPEPGGQNSHADGMSAQNYYYNPY